MKKGGTGGSHTSKTGLDFEVATDQKFIKDLELFGYLVSNTLKLTGANGPVHGRRLENSLGDRLDIFYKSGLYKLFFEPRNINYKDFFSARLEPDTAIFSEKTNTLTIIEKKQMVAAGSVAEKLQTCDYKKIYYETLLTPLDVNLEIAWILGPYFKQQESQLKSVYEYMLSKGSKYYFGTMPISELKI